MWGDSGFGGGGYQQGGMNYTNYDSNAGFTSPQVGGSQEQRGLRSRSMMSVTVHQLMNAEQQDDAFLINGRDVHQITFVGRIMTVQESSTNILYKIYDNTADPCEVRKWIDSDDSTADIDKRSECREGVVVRVYGHLRVFQGQKSVVAFAVSPVTDFNEITFHILDIVHTHLALTKATNIPNSDFAAVETVGFGNDVRGFGQGVTPGMSRVQNEVYQCIIACGDEAGIHIKDLLTQCRQKRVGDAEVRQAVEFLSNEGHVYSTIDDDHFRATDV
ncbi:replication protein A 32 kDa subunit-like [Corticium candelabrum]|uniref:replication protein A 32 kDa subunit-like n=1 Tax=Corticium candelabrum TaxID=121492 RepID=UPI002E255940|nr:replication protein A 32 kDa subunit-like [Corticium candelabrum]